MEWVIRDLIVMIPKPLNDFGDALFVIGFEAQLDPIYRAGYVDPNLGIAEEGDVQDLRNPITVTNQEMFKSKDHCLLNPTFW